MVETHSLSRALNSCIEDINRREQNIKGRRLREYDVDARFIAESFRNIGILLDVFQESPAASMQWIYDRLCYPRLISG